MKKQFIILLAAIAFAVTGCQKELSFEQAISPSEGSLQSDINSDCLPKTVNGIYEVGEDLVGNTNNITVDINVTKTGSYVVTTDTINGIFFRGVGTFTSLGTNTVTLRGSGTPFAAGTFNFMVSYDSTFCDVQVDVLPAGAGGPSTFSLVAGGSPSNCASAVVSGIYVKDAVVNASNYVDVTVNVTVIGTYTITASGGGMTFTKSGAFLTTGNQTVRLTATGTPTTVGANTITFTIPSGGCTFNVDVVPPAVYAVDCPSSFASGTYQAGTALGSSNTITVALNVTTAGPVSITTAAVNGMVFSGSANFASTGAQTLVLTGSGTPTTGGNFNIPVSGSCNVAVIVAAAPTIDWSFKIGTTTYQGSTVSADYDNSTAPPFSLFSYVGDNGAGDDFSIDLTDITGGIQANENFNTNILTLANFGTFYYFGAGLDLEADPTVTPAVNILIKVTGHNTTTKTITGTFSGTAKDIISGTTKTISNGQFTAVYP